MPEITFIDHLHRIRTEAPSQAKKGEWFEIAVKAILQLDPVQQLKYNRVWTWREWAGEQIAQGNQRIRLNDIGIDLVAELADESGLAAIQCKCYDNDATLYREDIDAIVAAAAAHPELTKTVLVHTAGALAKNAKVLIDNTRTRVIGRADLASASIIWPEDLRGQPIAKEAREPWPHQREAIDCIKKGLSEADRGRVIMACGTGKTFTALRAAEEMHPSGGRILIGVPSLALAAQAMRDWSRHAKLPHSYIAVNSDVSSGRATANQGTIAELAIPPTTDPDRIRDQLKKRPKEKLQVTFATYHSMAQVRIAQDRGAPAFDLAIADEAHRTTGVGLRVMDEEEEQMQKGFHLIHDADGAGIRAKKRLYMTATEKIYSGDSAKSVREHGANVFTMDDEKIYGKRLYHLTFREAVDLGILADYDIVVLGITEEFCDREMLRNGSGYGLSLTAKSRVMGLFSAVHQPNDPARPNYLPKRMIAYWNTRKASRAFVEFWQAQYSNPTTNASERVQQLGANQTSHARHLEGTMTTSERADAIQDLADGGRTKSEVQDPGHCEIISNVNILREGVDVPALDGIAFVEPRTSYIDIVQAVGRVMRRDPNDPTKRGLIIIPVAMRMDSDAENRLKQNQDFKTIVRVINAMRSHDEQLDNDINAMRHEAVLPRNVHIRPALEIGPREPEANPLAPALMLDLQGGHINIPLEDLQAYMLPRCTDSDHWRNWIQNIGDLFNRVRGRIETLRQQDPAIATRLEKTGKALKNMIGKMMGEDRVVEIIGQHVVVRRVLNAIFDNASIDRQQRRNFIRENRVARVLERDAKALENAGLKDELAELEPFYDSVERQARSIKTEQGRQNLLHHVLQDLVHLLNPKEAKARGVHYTPLEAVEFMVRSVEALSRKHWGRGLTDEGVHVMDPFTGTGAFPVAILQSGLVRPEDLARKFEKEIHANEVMLLPFYIALLNISQAYERQARANGHDPSRGPGLFPLLRYTDSFTATKVTNGNGTDYLEGLDPDWDEAIKELKDQRKQPIAVIATNPPWRVGQGSADEENRNESYPRIDARIRETYGIHMSSSSTTQMYDQYVRAIRYATDRVEDDGIIALITNESWYKAWSNDGIRAWMENEFAELYVVALGGNAREGKKGNGNIFDGIRLGSTIILGVRKTDHKGPARIWLWNLDIEMSGANKRKALAEAGSILEVDLKEIHPTEKHEWAEVGDALWDDLMPLMRSSRKSARGEVPLLRDAGPGFKTGQDWVMLNFSEDRCNERGNRMVDAFNEGIGVTSPKNDERIKWHDDLLRLGHKQQGPRSPGAKATRAMLGPFIEGWVYWDHDLLQRPGRSGDIFGLNHEERKAEVLNVTSPGMDETGCFVAGKATDLSAMGKTHSGDISGGDSTTSPSPPPPRQQDWQSGLRPTERLESSQRETRQISTASLQCKWRTSLSARKANNNDNRREPERAPRSAGDSRSIRAAHVRISSPSRANGDDMNRLFKDLPEETTTDSVLSLECVEAFRKHYRLPGMTEWEIKCYCVGVLHADDYREEFRVNLKRDLPRIPFAEDFIAFRDAGEELIHMQLNYRDVPEYVLDVVVPNRDRSKCKPFEGEPLPDQWRIKRQMDRIWEKRPGDTKVIAGVMINNEVGLVGIPDISHRYKIAGLEAIEYLIRKLKVHTNDSGEIYNDANDCYDDEWTLRKHIQKVVWISKRSGEIIDELPPAVKR